MIPFCKASRMGFFECSIVGSVIRVPKVGQRIDFNKTFTLLYSFERNPVKRTAPLNLMKVGKWLVLVKNMFLKSEKEDHLIPILDGYTPDLLNKSQIRHVLPLVCRLIYKIATIHCGLIGDFNSFHIWHRSYTYLFFPNSIYEPIRLNGSNVTVRDSGIELGDFVPKGRRMAIFSDDGVFESLRNGLVLENNLVENEKLAERPFTLLRLPEKGLPCPERAMEYIQAYNEERLESFMKDNIRRNHKEQIEYKSLQANRVLFSYAAQMRRIKSLEMMQRKFVGRLQLVKARLTRPVYLDSFSVLSKNTNIFIDDQIVLPFDCILAHQNETELLLFRLLE